MKGLLRDLDENLPDEVIRDFSASPISFLISFDLLSTVLLAAVVFETLFAQIIRSNFLCPPFQLDEEDFKEEQNSVSRLIQMLHNDDPEEMLKVTSDTSF